MTTEYLSDNQIFSLFTPRAKACHKGDFGKCAIFGGSKDFVGAAKLASLGAISMRMGVGYTSLAVIESQIATISPEVFECILCPQKEIDGHFEFDENRVQKAILGVQSVAVGMGMTKSNEVKKLVAYLFDNFFGNVILDADGLNSVDDEFLSQKRSCKLILTPHYMEFSRLIGKDVSYIKENEVELAKKYAKKWNAILHLKSEQSITTDGERVFRVKESSPSLAKAGSGDFLAGAIAGLSANHDSFLSVCVAAEVIARVAIKESRKYNDNVLLARDFVDGVRDFFIEEN